MQEILDTMFCMNGAGQAVVGVHSGAAELHDALYSVCMSLVTMLKPDCWCVRPVGRTLPPLVTKKNQC